MSSPKANYPASTSKALNESNATPSRLPSWGPWGWAIVSGAVLAIGLPIMALRNITGPQTHQPQQAEKAVAARRQVAAPARIEPEGGSIDVGIPLGSIVQTLNVTSGDTVEKDQILAYLNGHEEQLANLDLIASQLAEAKYEVESSLEFNQAEIEAAAVQLDGVGRPQTSAVIAQEAILRQRTVDYNQAQTELNRFERLFREGAIARQDYEQQQIRVNQLRESRNQARANLNQLSDRRQIDIANAAAQLNMAQANREKTIGQNQIASVQQQLALAEAQLERTIIRAPRSGEVLRILTNAGESAIENGLGGGTLLQLGNTSQMYAIAEVNESEASLVEPDQSATIVSRNNTFEGEIPGTVEFIGRQIFKNNLLDDDPAAFDDARVVEVKIRLDDSDLVAGLTNLQVDVRINVNPDSESSSVESNPLASEETVVAPEDSR